MSVFFKRREAAFCWVDVSCVNIFYTASDDVSSDNIINSVSPREIVVSESSSFVRGEVINREKFEDWIP